MCGLLNATHMPPSARAPPPAVHSTKHSWRLAKVQCLHINPASGSHTLVEVPVSVPVDRDVDQYAHANGVCRALKPNKKSNKVTGQGRRKSIPGKHTTHDKRENRRKKLNEPPTGQRNRTTSNPPW